MRQPMQYLRLGNAKLGRTIWTWSLPAIDGCGDAPSDWCVKHCYAKRFNRFPSVSRAYQRNLALARDPKRFIGEISKELKLLPRGSVVRLHVAGDFFDGDYIRSWISIARRFRRIEFYGYTRAWNIPGLADDLDDLRFLANVTLWASTDESMPSAPEGWPEARVVSAPAAGLDLGYFVCPEQTGRKPSCELCRYCWTQAGTPRLAFVAH